MTTTPASGASRAPHPHFDDRGTLHWHTRLADALAAARAGSRLVFIEVGREACGQCRALVQGLVPEARTAALLQEGFVALAADADETEDEVLQLVLQVPDAMMLPIVIFADAEGRYLEGSSGAIAPAAFRATLERLRA